MDTISVDVTQSVAYALLPAPGLPRTSGSDRHTRDGSWTWQADEALGWALVDIAQDLDAA